MMVKSILKPSGEFLLLLYSYFLPYISSLPAAKTSTFSRIGITIFSGAVPVPAACANPSEDSVKLPIKSIRSPGLNKPSNESILLTFTLRERRPNSMFSE